MKRKETPYLRIGIFVLLGFGVLLVFIFFIGGKEQLFTRTATVYARFSTVSSLLTGARVEMAGIGVGNVNNIALPKRASDSATVTMSIEEDAMPLIHPDSRAIITTAGLIGDKYIMITLGRDSLKPITSGATIQGVPPQDFGKIYDTLSAAVSQVNRLTGEGVSILQSIRSGQGSLGKLIYSDSLYHDFDKLTTNVSSSVKEVTNSFDTLSGAVTEIANKVNRGEGSIGKALTSDDLYNDMKTSTENLRLSSADLRDAMAKLSLGSGRFAEDAEALKHNFLFKGYFEDRGYWDAPDFEVTIDRKLDSLSHLSQKLEEQLRQMRMLSPKPSGQ